MMEGPEKIADGIYLIGGPNVSHSEDATVFAITFEKDIVLIDSGAGNSVKTLVKNMDRLSLDPLAISLVILTHCHIDHIGGAPFFKKQFGGMLAIHENDAQAVEEGDPILTAANWYGVDFPPTPVDVKISGNDYVFKIGGDELHCLHTPGHTPGSISVYLDRSGQRILFGQDIHGPFLRSFRSDVSQWRESMHRLIELQADILCEGHFGIFRGKERVARYIEGYLDQDF